MFKVVLLLLIPMLVVANYTGSAATFDDYIKRIYNDNVFNKEQKTQLKFILKEAIHEQKLERLKTELMNGSRLPRCCAIVVHTRRNWSDSLNPLIR